MVTRCKQTRRKRRRGGLMQFLVGGSNPLLQIQGGYTLRGGRTPFAVSDYPPGFNKFTRRDKRKWTKIKRKYRRKKHKSKHRRSKHRRSKHRRSKRRSSRHRRSKHRRSRHRRKH
jgi:ATPase subunit of ABC transporter with duplicated ATPase domains